MTGMHLDLDLPDAQKLQAALPGLPQTCHGHGSCTDLGIAGVAIQLGKRLA